jgi:hypothetical protein
LAGLPSAKSILIWLGTACTFICGGAKKANTAWTGDSQFKAVVERMDGCENTIDPMTDSCLDKVPQCVMARFQQRHLHRLWPQQQGVKFATSQRYQTPAT